MLHLSFFFHYNQLSAQHKLLLRHLIKACMAADDFVAGHRSRYGYVGHERPGGEKTLRRRGRTSPAALRPLVL
jgi:hypothetical protein